jgi:hypothetical protein
MSSLDPIEGVSGVSSVNQCDPSTYNSSSSSQNTSSIDSMAESLGMSKKEEEKFISNVMNYISHQHETESKHLEEKMKEAIQAINQA